MASVMPYLQTPWVKLLSLVAPSFPAPPDSIQSLLHSERWLAFELKCAIAPLGVLLLGCIVAYRLACCGRRVPANLTKSPEVLLWRGCITIGLSIAGLLCFVQGSYIGYIRLNGRLTEMTHDVHLAAFFGKELEDVTMEANGTLNAIASVVTANTSEHEVAQLLTTALHRLEGAFNQTADFNSNIQHIPAGLEGVKDHLDDAARRYGWISLALPVTPLFLVIVTCTALYMSQLVVSCLAATCCGCFSRCMSRIQSWFLRKVGTVLLAPVVLVAALVVSVELGCAIGLGSFCKNVDANAVAYIQHFAGPEVYDTSAYYITGNAVNPLLDHVNKVSALIQPMHLQLEGNRSVLEDACHVESVSDALGQLQSVMNLTETLTTVLDRKRVYAYYQKVVHEELCTSMLSGLSWLSILESLVGIICLPCLVCSADDYFQQMSLEEREQRGLSSPLANPADVEGTV